jgi:GNAT superfamily N-acetyltransferase
VIRRARVQDAAALADINRRGWLVAYAHIVAADMMRAAGEDLEARWAEGLAGGDDAGEVWVATDADADAAAIGFVSVGSLRDADARPGEGELRAIYLAPETMGTGVGRELLARGERALARLGHTAATLWVFEENVRARRFYERNGWAPEPDSGPGPWGWAPSVRYRKGLT